MPDSNSEQSDRDLLIGLHTKLDAMRRSYQRVLRDRLKDRDTIQRHDRRIEHLEHQVALLTSAVPGVKNWRASAADITTSEHTIADLAEIELDAEVGGDGDP